MRWQVLTTGAPEEARNAAWHSIQQHYTEPVRAYHNLEHLEELFDWASGLVQELERPELVHWTIFYHDIIYLPGSGQNEDLSADMAEQTLPNLGVSPEDISIIAAWIRASKSHSLPASADSPDARLFLDMDLAILGSSEERYQRYAEQIRTEYAKFSDLLYKPGRRKVLKHFLKKERIYASDTMHKLLDAAARNNLMWELRSL